MIITEYTQLINIATQSYPVTLSQVKRDLPNLSFPLEPTDAQLLELGYAVVEPLAKPEGDVVTEAAPVLTDGIYAQGWDIRSFNEAEVAQQLVDKKAAMQQEVDTLRDAALVTGTPYLFPNDITNHIQLRNGDRANLTGLRIQADYLKVTGVMDPVFSFRTYENINHLLTPQQMIDVTNTALTAYMVIMSNGWTLKDQIAAALTIGELPVLPTSL